MFKKILFSFIVIFLIFIIFLFSINVSIITRSTDYIVDNNIVKDIDADCILVLGASVYKNGKPSKMLKDRLDMGVYLYNNSKTKKILMSGDHRSDEYDEVNVMKNYALDKKIPSSDIFKDHEGINTYQSLYRAKYVYGVKKVIIVTQKYHLYRAIYIAKKLDLDVTGVASDGNNYHGQINREFREILARIKAYFNTNVKKESTHTGITYDITGNGDITN